MSNPRTVRVVNKNDEDGYTIINQEDFDLDQASEKPQYKLHKTNDAHQIEQDGGPPAPTTRNPSGTYSEPTPTDIRYPDKNATEFENNSRAGVSAAEAREAAGMEDKPGGIIPEQHENVQEAEAALRETLNSPAGDGPKVVPQVVVTGVEEAPAEEDTKKKKK